MFAIVLNMTAFALNLALWLLLGSSLAAFFTGVNIACAVLLAAIKFDEPPTR